MSLGSQVHALMPYVSRLAVMIDNPTK